MKSQFIHLHVHSHYSLLDGLSKIDDLINKTVEYQMPALAITDHGVMYGALEFYQKCLKAGIKPIIGCEVYIAPRTLLDKTPKIDTRPFHLVLLAKDQIGYKNLIKLTTEAHLKGYYYKPRIDKKILKQYGVGLIALSACLHGEIPRLILNKKYIEAKKACAYYQSIFGPEGFYLELQNHPELPEQKIANEGLIKISHDLKIPLVATNDSHYLNTDDRDAHEVLLAVQQGKDFDDKERLSMTKIDLSLKKPEIIIDEFKKIPEAISNSIKIANLCNLQIETGKIILPKFPLTENKSSEELLNDLCYQGLNERYPTITKEIRERMNYELSIIKKMGFADYFLIVADFVNWAKSKGIIVGPGRGSAAGSIVSYCLKITDLDPIKYNLMFERFLNPDRISMPDIDMDFADDRRDEVIDYVRRKYGDDHVAQIITFGVMKAKMSVRDCGRALGMTYQDVDRIAKLIPFGLTIDQALEESKDLAKAYNNEPETKRLIDMSKKLEGVVRHASTHAAGIVISRNPLTDYLPLQKSTRGKEEIITQYDMYNVESLGLLKMDFLGLANLTIIKNALRIIRKTKEHFIDITKIPLDDPKTYKLLSEGKTTGIFQFESDGMKKYLKELKPTKIEDIIAMVALYRPGPIEFIPNFIARKHGKKKITYIHESVKEILEPTYGIMVYQEQMMKMSQVLAGFSGAEADTLRKGVAKKIKKILDKLEPKFIEGCAKIGYINKEKAQSLWKEWLSWAKYGFNKSHAACYAIIAYQTAYLKAHYPAEFMAALLTSDFQDLDRVAIEIAECERMGIKVLPPNINNSFVEFGVNQQNGNITFSLAAIKNVGVGVAEKIVEERKKDGDYKTLEDFIIRLGPEVINKKTMESLARAGAFDNLVERNKILANMDVILKFASISHKINSSGQMGLFGQEDTKAITLKLRDIEPASKKQRLTWEKELLGIYISEHPLDEFKEILKNNIPQISSFNSDQEGKKVKVAGIITSVQKIITKNKEPMIFARIEDTSGQIEILVFPKILKKNSLIWTPDSIVIVEGKLNVKDGVLKILADNVTNLGEQINLFKQKERKKEKILELTISEKSDKNTLKKIKNLLDANPGDTKVMLKFLIKEKEKTMFIKNKVSISSNLQIELEKIIGLNKVKII